MANSYQNVPALRSAPDAPDTFDGARVEMVRHLWHSQDSALLLRDRVVEESIRMLSGQQWSVFSPLLGRFVDITEYMDEEERRWRQRPVLNRLMAWFIITHARMTENPAIITFVPGPDSIDAQLAELMDTAFKIVWRDVEMDDVWDRVAAWMAVAGRGYTSSRIDPLAGDVVPRIGSAELPMLDGQANHILNENGEPVMQMRENVPFGKDFEPLVHGILPNGELLPHVDDDGNALPPATEHEGALAVDVHSPLEVRGQWGPTPWHKKDWHAVRSYLTPEELWDLYQVDCPPDVWGVSQDNAGYLQRLLFGSGYWGAAQRMFGAQDSRSSSPAQGTTGYVEVSTFWRKPCSFGGMDQTEQSAGGRLLVTTRTKVLRDGVRPGKFKWTSPIRAYDFIRLPGRTHGSTPLEMLLAPQRAYNRGWGQIMEHRNLVTNPKYVVDKGSGMANVVVTNQPGEGYAVSRRPNVPPFEWVPPPALSADVWRTQQQLLSEIFDIGNLKGTEGAPPTDDPSGELVKELRFNSDRFLGPPLRRAPGEIARMADDWKVLLPTIWDREKVISYVGEDNRAMAITVFPEIFEQGNVHVIPDVESMLPEGRGERQARVYKMWQDGMFGFPPQDPKAIRRYLELARFPHLGQAVRPGGEDRPTADQFLGALLQGVPASDTTKLPIFPWYDLGVHMDVLESFMKRPEFLKLEPQIQQNLEMRWKMLQSAMMSQLIQKMKSMGPPPGMAPGGPPGAPARPGGPPPAAGGPPMAPLGAVTHRPDSVPAPAYPGAVPSSRS